MNNEMPRLIETVKDGILDSSARCQRWLDTPNGRGVLKCTIAYTIASLRVNMLSLLLRFTFTLRGRLDL